MTGKSSGILPVIRNKFFVEAGKNVKKKSHSPQEKLRVSDCQFEIFKKTVAEICGSFFIL
jgi:hypothetical protein